MKKRLFSILLSICMVLTMIPMAGGGVFAQTTEHKHCVCGAEHQTIGDHTAEDADVSKRFKLGKATINCQIKREDII